MNLETDFARHKFRVDGVTGTNRHMQIEKYIKGNSKVLIPIGSLILLLLMKPGCIYDTKRNKQGTKKQVLSITKLLIWSGIISGIIWFLLKEKLS